MRKPDRSLADAGEGPPRGGRSPRLVEQIEMDLSPGGAVPLQRPADGDDGWQPGPRK